MSIADTIPTGRVTVPSALAGANNGQLPDDWLRSPYGSSRLDRKMFAPVSYAMQAMILAAAEDGIDLRTTGEYRSYVRQVALFNERYTTTPIPGRPTKWWNGQLWYQKPGVAMAATPGTSNHGLGLADDIAVELDGDPDPESIDWPTIEWLRDNAPSFGFGLETRKELWHWHWIGGDRIPQRAVDVLAKYGIPLPDLAGWLMTAPAPTPPPDEEDDMAMTPEERAALVNDIADATVAKLLNGHKVRLQQPADKRGEERTLEQLLVGTHGEAVVAREQATKAANR